MASHSAQTSAAAVTPASFAAICYGQCGKKIRAVIQGPPHMGGTRTIRLRPWQTCPLPCRGSGFLLQPAEGI
ncbi:hypothetical protein V6N13_025556 [Hibiscus sabdariffa]